MATHYKRVIPRSILNAAVRIAVEKHGILVQRFWESNHSPKVVDARRTVIGILYEQGYGCTATAQALQMHHTSILYHLHGRRRKADYTIPVPDLSGEWAI